MGRLFLKIDQTEWPFGDFSTESKLTGTIYTDKELVTPKDLTGFTISIKLFRRWHRMSFISQNVSAVSAVNGTWEYAVTESDFIHPGLFQLELELTKSGVRESTKPVEFYVKWSPA